jgi:hypothetical protein
MAMELEELQITSTNRTSDDKKLDLSTSKLAMQSLRAGRDIKDGTGSIFAVSS